MNNTTIIEPSKGWRLIDIGELIRYKDLFYFLVLRNVKILYKQTVLGFAWAIIRPFFSMIVFSLVFGKLAKVPSDGIPYPIFSYAALGIIGAIVVFLVEFNNAMTTLVLDMFIFFVTFLGVVDFFNGPDEAFESIFYPACFAFGKAVSLISLGVSVMIFIAHSPLYSKLYYDSINE